MRLVRQFSYYVAVSLRTFQEKGIWAGLAELVRTFHRAVYQRSEYIVVARSLSEPVPQLGSRPGLVIRQAEHREEIAKLATIADRADMARFYGMFDKGSIAFLALQDSQVAGYGWSSRESNRGLNPVQPLLQPGDVCMHDLFVGPAYRGQGIGRALITHRLRFLRDHGYGRAVAAVLRDNSPALKLHKEIGYVPIAGMNHTRVLFWGWFCHMPACDPTED